MNTQKYSESKLTEAVAGFQLKILLAYLTRFGRKTYGDYFKLWSEDIPVIKKLFIYFLADTSFALEEGINLNKGILLVGPIGCGKTSVMRLMLNFLHPKDKFLVKPCWDISFEFHESGFQVISNYSSRSSRLVDGVCMPSIYCFDDLGVEQSIKYFGNSCNVMQEILLSRYDAYINLGTHTHLTTNFNLYEIEKVYGKRVLSRIREMFNVIHFDKYSPDKRAYL